MLGIIISRARLTFRPLWLFLEKKNVMMALVPRFIDGVLIYVWYDNISSKFDFQGAWIKAKVVVAILEEKKNFVIAHAPAFINGF